MKNLTLRSIDQKNLTQKSIIFYYLENKLGGENPAICWGENGADDGGGGGGMPGPNPWLPLVTGGDERPGIIELPIEFGDVPL